MVFIRKNAPPASAAALIAHASELRAGLGAKRHEHDGLTDALPTYVADREAFARTRADLNALAAVIRTDEEAIALIEAQIPQAEERERRERFQAELDERVRQSDRLQRGLEARYTKAAEAFAEVCREIQADADAWRVVRAGADCFKPRVPTPHKTAEMALRYDQFASPNYGLKSLTEDLTVRAWDGGTLFNSN